MTFLPGISYNYNKGRKDMGCKMRIMKKNFLSQLALSIVATLTATSAFALDLGDFNQECGCYKDIPYGEKTWIEQNTGESLRQDFNLYPVNTTQGKAPLIIFAHPNGSTKHMLNGGRMYDVIVGKAKEAGFAVMSIEFRHPVANDDIIPAPHRDIIRAIRYARANASTLGIDSKNVFLLGQSRGALAIWTGLQREMADPTSDNILRQQSNKVNAVYAYNPQTTYLGEELAHEFIIAPQRRQFTEMWLQEHPQNPLFVSALSSVTRDDPPLMIKVERPFFRRAVPMQMLGVHHPDFGLRMCEKYNAAGIGDRCQVTDRVSAEHAYDGYIDFFKSNLK